MSRSYVLPLNDPQATLENVGGKGASLARLMEAGLPVPDGFHVTTDVYRAFVAANDLQPRILAALKGVDPPEPAALERASDAIQGLFAGAQVPADITGAIVQAYGELPGLNPAVAVRSSATAEDLPEASFAGQQETYLNVSGTDAVLAATVKCWASLWTARAIGYRGRQGILPDEVALAVVVQLLVPAETAGILFTANPINGRRDQVVISAAWGLGEAVVGGMVTPDSLTVDKATGRVLERQTADKQVMTARRQGGTHETPVPENLRRMPVLSDQAVAELTRMARRIEELYGAPMDIEWALADGKYAIVQARPITALPAEPATAAAASAQSTTWPMPNPKAWYARGSLCEHLPNPVSPLFGTLGVRLANQATDELMRGFTDAHIEYGYCTINGYVYLGTLLGLREIWTYTKMSLGLLGTVLRTGTERWQAARLRLMDAVARWEGKSVETRAPSELLAGARELFLEAARFYTVIQAGTLPTATTSETMFKQMYKLVKGKDGPDPTTFLFGFDTTPLKAEKALYDLAAWVKDRPALDAYVRSTPTDRLVDDLGVDRSPEDISSDVWAEWRARGSAHLERYGKTVYEFDFVNPTPIEAPEPLLDAVKMYLDGQGTDPHARQRGAAARREQATQEVFARVGWPRANLFRKALNWAQQSGPVREDSLADLGLAHPAIRGLLGELGHRGAAAQAIETAEDIYWLEEGEVETLVTALERSDALPDYRARVPARKAECHAQQRLAPPVMLPEKSRWAKIMPWSEQWQEGRTVLKGVGTSAGQVTATACVLFGPEDFAQMRPGDVLVAVTTTPAWTPLFAMASAVVTDIGGPLSHSSIVAREYGIPAVMATGVATRRIRSGQTITIDGGAGTVEIA